MPRLPSIAAACLMGLLAASCGQKGGLYLPDSAPAKVHAPPATAPASPSAPPAAPADDPATRRKAPATPDPSTSQ